MYVKENTEQISNKLVHKKTVMGSKRDTSIKYEESAQVGRSRRICKELFGLKGELPKQ